MSQITPVILVGGSGKRLWPLSRESMPKQFVPLLGQAIDLPADAGAGRRPWPVRQAGDRHQRRLPFHGRAAGQGHRHGDRHPGRAVAPRFRAGHGRRGGLHAKPGRQGRANAGIGPSGDRRRGIPRWLPRRPDGRATGRHRHLWHSADGAQNRLRLHPPGQREHRPGAEGRGIRREARCQDGDALHRRRPAMEQRQLPVCAGGAAVRDGPLRACHGRRRRGGRSQSEEGRLDRFPRRGGLRQGAGQIDRLRRHGTHRQVLGGAGQIPLVRSRHLGRPARHRQCRFGGQRHRRARSNSTMYAIPTSAPMDR